MHEVEATKDQVTLDVQKVASALIEDNPHYEDGGDHDSEHWACSYCHASYEKEKDFKHDLSCVALIAQDLLTGSD